jgi:hypothetical protein
MAEKSLKTGIVSFRVTQEQATAVTKFTEDHGVLHASSVAKFFRKIGLDFLAGRVVYTDPKHMRTDPNSQPVAPLEKA